MTEPAVAVEQDAAPPQKLNKGVASAAVAEAVSYGVSIAVRLGSNLILTRLLMPEAFGLMALSYTVIYTLWLLSEVGLSDAMIMSPRGEQPDFIDTIWTLQAMRGVALWVGTCVLAWPMQAVFREPKLIWVMPILGLTTFIHGFASPRIMLLRRQIRPVPVMLTQLAGMISGSAVNITGAWMGMSVAALIAGALTQSAVETASSHFLPGTHRPRLRIVPDCRKEIVSFGKWIFWSSCVLALAQRGDQITLGRLLGAAQVGVYGVALALAEMPEALAGNVIRHVVYPAISRARNEAPAQFAATYYRLRGWIDPLVHISLGGLVALSDWVIRLLYPDTYGGASAILRVLALRSSVHLVTQMCEQCFFACGESQYGFRRNMVVSISTFVCLPVGAYFAGMEGVLWGSVVARGMPLFVLWPAARERGFLWLSREALVVAYLALGYTVGLGAEQILPAWRLR